MRFLDGTWGCCRFDGLCRRNIKNTLGDIENRCWQRFVFGDGDVDFVFDLSRFAAKLVVLVDRFADAQNRIPEVSVKRPSDAADRWIMLVDTGRVAGELQP